MKVTNSSRGVTYSYVKAGGAAKDGVPETVSVGPGETAEIDVPEGELVRLHADIAFGDLTASDEDRNKAAAAMATPETPSLLEQQPPPQ